MYLTARALCFFGASLAFCLPGVSLGQIKPLASGDWIVRERLVAEQLDGTISFAPRGRRTYELLIAENGDRRFLSPKPSAEGGGDRFVSFATDKNFTQITFMNNPVPDDERFVRLPPGGQLRPGMQWAVPSWKVKTSCGGMEVKYQATSSTAPAISVVMNGTPTQIATMKISYEARLPTCEGGWIWRKTNELLYSPELNEIMSSRVINWSAYGNTTLLDSGDGWSIVEVRTKASH